MVVLDLKARSLNARPRKGDPLATRDEDQANQHPSSSFDSGQSDMIATLLTILQVKLFQGDSYKDLAAEAENVKARLKTASGNDISLRSSAEIETMLETYRARLQESNRQTAIDFKRILNLVNDSFGCILAGDEKSDERLKYLETNLRQATKMDSLVSLRRHLTGMLEFVRKESKLDLVEKESRLGLSEEVRQAQLTSVRLHVQMPGRSDALNHMRDLVAASFEKADAQVTLFVVDTLKALRARHGEEIASSILEELGRKQIQPLAPEGKLFCWSASSLVLIARPRTAGNSAGLLCAVPSTFEHRAFTGTRLATFQVNVRSISKALSSRVEDVTTILDRFSKETDS